MLNSFLSFLPRPSEHWGFVKEVPQCVDTSDCQDDVLCFSPSCEIPAECEQRHDGACGRSWVSSEVGKYGGSSILKVIWY